MHSHLKRRSGIPILLLQLPTTSPPIATPQFPRSTLMNDRRTPQMRSTVHPSTHMRPTSALYDRLEMKQPPGTRPPSSTRSPKPVLSIVTITFDGSSDFGQVEDVQATAQDAPIALPSDQIEYEHIRWGVTEPTRSSCPLRDALEICLPLPRNDPQWLGERRWGLWRIHLRYGRPLDCPRL